jgi:hypothetical protein
MPQMQRCEQGHFYDASVNRRCPACGIPGLDINPTRAATGAYSEPAAAPRPEPPAARPTRPVGGGDGLTRGARDLSEGRTVAWWDKEKTGTNPVVGWLVAISGPNKGRDYRIYSEGNSIGRAPENKIAIQGDETISRDKHAILFYDPLSEDAAYHIHTGGGPMVYLNGKAVYQPTPLKAYDIITLGNTKLLFVPLCNERFQWTVDKEKTQGQEAGAQ